MRHLENTNTPTIADQAQDLAAKLLKTRGKKALIVTGRKDTWKPLLVNRVAEILMEQTENDIEVTPNLSHIYDMYDLLNKTKAKYNLFAFNTKYNMIFPSQDFIHHHIEKIGIEVIQDRFNILYTLEKMKIIKTIESNKGRNRQTMLVCKDKDLGDDICIAIKEALTANKVVYPVYYRNIYFEESCKVPQPKNCKHILNHSVANNEEIHGFNTINVNDCININFYLECVKALESRGLKLMHVSESALAFTYNFHFFDNPDDIRIDVIISMYSSELLYKIEITDPKHGILLTGYIPTFEHLLSDIDAYLK